MTSRWFLVLLLLLALISVVVHCCRASEGEDSQGLAKEGVVGPDEEGFEDEDELEDLDERSEAGGGVSNSFSSVETIAASKLANVNDQDVERVVARFEYVLLLGYAPWCTQSQKLLPEFAAAALTLSQLGNPTMFAKVDAINNLATASRYEIRGYPTLLFFLNGSRQAYSGGLSREEISLWVRKKTDNAVITIRSKEEAEIFLKKNLPLVLGYFDKLEGPEHEAFVAAAKLDMGTEFLQTTVVEAAQLFIRPPFIALHKPVPEYFSAFDGSLSPKYISSFVEMNKRPLLIMLNSKNSNMVYSSPLKLHVLLFAETKDYESLKPTFLEAARDFKSKVMFVVVDMEDKDFAMPMLAMYGLDKKKPVVAGLNNEDGSKYLLESDLTIENLKQFAADFYSRKLPLYFKSQPVPAQNGLVKIVVGKTFDEVVMDDSKDVFLQVYTPWCPSCEKVDRVFEKLARHVQKVPSLVMAKFDIQANEHPSLMYVHTHPMLLLYPAGRKSSKPIVVQSQASWKKLLIFVKENVAIPFPVSKGDDILPKVGGVNEAAGLDAELVKGNNYPLSDENFMKELVDEASESREIAKNLCSSSRSDNSLEGLYIAELNDEL